MIYLKIQQINKKSQIIPRKVGKRYKYVLQSKEYTNGE